MTSFTKIKIVCGALIALLIALFLGLKFIWVKDTSNLVKTEFVFSPTEEDVEKANKELKEQEMRAIEAFLSRSSWQLEKTPRGMYYRIYDKNPKGASIEKGNAVKISYTVSLLNGTQIASSKEDGLKEWVVGESSVEAGLNELVQKMRNGEKANAIIPSHLAYALSGEIGKIPPGATLLYDLEIKGVYIRATLK